MLNFPGFFFFVVLVMSKTKSLLLIILGTEAPSPPRQGLLEVKQPTNPVDKKKNHHGRCRFDAEEALRSRGAFFVENPGGFCQRQRCGKGKALEFFEADAYEDGMPC